MLDLLTGELLEDLAAQGVLRPSRVEHDEADVPQQPGSHVQITDGA